MKDTLALLLFAFVALGGYTAYLYLNDPYQFHQMLDSPIKP